MDDISVLNLFLDAGLVVKTVMIILLIASLLTWIVIVERYNFYKKLFFKESFAHENQKWTLVKKDKIIVWNID